MQQDPSTPPHPRTPGKAWVALRTTGGRKGATWSVLLAIAVAASVLAWRQPPLQFSSVTAQPAGLAAKGGQRIPRLASFGDEQPGADVRHVANWVTDSGDHANKAFALVDKQEARVWLFNPGGELIAVSPALIGSAVGDDAVPGIGDKPLSQVLPEERTTPAGRYVAERGVNAGGEDIVWVSYDLAVSMHRVRPNVKAEQRLERLSSPEPDDNRISFGCINLPVTFYEEVLSPTVHDVGMVVYVLPETRTPQEQFGSYDVPLPAQLARAGSASPVK